MTIVESAQTSGMFFAMTKSNKIEKIFFNIDKAKEYIKDKNEDIEIYGEKG